MNARKLYTDDKRKLPDLPRETTAEDLAQITDEDLEKHPEWMDAAVWKAAQYDEQATSWDDDDPEAPVSWSRTDWVDHAYKTWRAGTPIFVSEPYDLGNEDFAELGALVTLGWEVTLSNLGAIWNPGRCFRIEITKDTNR